MIGVFDISKSVIELLKNNGFLVVPMETREGFKKPACSVDVYLSEATMLNYYAEEDIFAAEIRYYPHKETYEELIRAADKLKSVILFNPLKINGRCIDTNTISFERDGISLFAMMEYRFTQNPHEDDEAMEPIENLEMEGI